METCSACKSILKPEYAFCPFCGAPRPEKTDSGEIPSEIRVEDGEIVLLTKPAGTDRVVYRSWEVLESGIRADKAPKTDPPLPGPGSLKPPADPPADKPGKSGKPEEKGLPDKPEKSGKPEEKGLPDKPGGPGLEEGGEGPSPLPDTPQEKIAEAIPGDQVRIGGLAWRVLWIRAGSCLLLADTPAAARRLAWSDQQVSWKTSALRKWLNRTFIEEHFRGELAGYLVSGKNSTRIRREDGYDFIESTEDRVVILSSQEYRFYVPGCRQSSWTTYQKKAAVRDLKAGMSGGGKILTLQIDKDREVWAAADVKDRLAVYPAIWWRTK